MRWHGVLLSLLLGLRPRARHPSACVRLGDLGGIAQINLVLRLWAIIPKPKNDGNRLVGELLVRTPPVCLGPPCNVINQSIVGLSPSSETAYPTGHDVSLWWNLWKLLLWLIVCTTLVAIVAYLVMITSTRTWAKNVKVRIHYLVAFWQTNPQAKSLTWLEVKSFF
jgi:hypothetical protein